MTGTPCIGAAQIIERETVYDGWYRFERLSIRMTDGSIAERHLLDNGSAAAVLPYDRERRCVLLITQARAGVLNAGEPPVLECIAGNLSGDSPETCARKEAMEEAGVRLGDLEPVSNIWPIPPVSTERVQIYLAPYSAEDRIGPGGGCPEENEQIAACEWNFDTLRELTFAGQLTDAKTLIAVQALMLRHPELWRPLRND